MGQILQDGKKVFGKIYCKYLDEFSSLWDHLKVLNALFGEFGPYAHYAHNVMNTPNTMSTLRI